MHSARDLPDLEALIHCARNQILPLATTGSEVQAVGEFWEAIDLWNEGRENEVEVNVSIGVFCKEGDPEEFLEHLHVDVRVSESAVELSTLRRTWTKEDGSDHHSEVLAVLSKGTRLSESGLAKWNQLLEEVVRYDSCRVSVSRDHL
ncbi:hypothetical protein ACWA7J_05930 [Leptothrix sp. BB-4]